MVKITFKNTTTEIGKRNRELDIQMQSSLFSMYFYLLIWKLEITLILFWEDFCPQKEGYNREEHTL